jgi:hypothetical protein
VSGGARRFTIMATLFLATACDPSEIAAPMTDKTADDDPATIYGRSQDRSCRTQKHDDDRHVIVRRHVLLASDA